MIVFGLFIVLVAGLIWMVFADHGPGPHLGWSDSDVYDWGGDE